LGAGTEPPSTARIGKEGRTMTAPFQAAERG
jgi:hypothetical protein